MSTLALDIPPALWLTSNRGYTNHGQKARVVRDIHALVKVAAREQDMAPIVGRRVHASWVIHYPKGTGWVHGDAANAHPTCKAILDALVPEWIEGDGPRFVRPETYDRGENLTAARVHRVALELIEVSAP